MRLTALAAIGARPSQVRS
jgi:integrase